MTKTVAEIAARRTANPNHPVNVLTRAINRAIAEGVPVYTDQPANLPTQTELDHRRGIAFASSVRPGQRYHVPVWLDAWMRGERYAGVAKVGREYVHLVGDHGLRFKVAHGAFNDHWHVV